MGPETNEGVVEEGVRDRVQTNDIKRNWDVGGHGREVIHTPLVGCIRQRGRLTLENSRP